MIALLDRVILDVGPCLSLPQILLASPFLPLRFLFTNQLVVVWVLLCRWLWGVNSNGYSSLYCLKTKDKGMLLCFSGEARDSRVYGYFLVSGPHLGHCAEYSKTSAVCGCVRWGRTCAVLLGLKYLIRKN